jgi:Zn-dependent protease with chaperone function
MTTVSPEAGEKPLNGLAKYSLILSATLVIALFYLFAVLSLAVLLLLLACELIAAAALARFGLVRVLAPTIRRHVALIVLVARSFWTRQRRTDFQVPLEPPDAPALFAYLETLSQRLHVRAPRQVRVEMTAGAWVRLKGFRRGAAATTLGLGYDLLVALNERELEAVLAHEMTHAKLVRRGLQTWLNGGLARAVKLTNDLSATVIAYRRARQTFELGEWLLNPADRCTRLMVRLVATYSRQDEFDADRGAAGICGSAPLRSSLLKLDQLHAKASRIGWNERVAQLQRGDGFSAWLTEELTVGSDGPGEQDRAGLVDSFSTHPSTQDRLAALPVDSTPVPSGRRAIELLANPDAIAGRLVTEVQRVARIEENRDARERRRWLKRLRRDASIQPVQWLGLLVGTIAIIIGCFAWVDRFSPVVLGIALLVMAGAVAIYRFGYKRDRRRLPVPSYEALKAHWENPDVAQAREAREKELVAVFKAATEGLKKKPKREHLLNEGYAALAECDYLRAHVAARLCLQLKGECAEARLVLAIASGAFHQSAQAGAMLAAANKAVGLRSSSSAWGAGWSLLLIGEWANAESFLAELQARHPEEVTFAALLALCQARRGKLHSAIANARLALAADPLQPARIKLLAELLLDGGYLRDAQQLLTEADNLVRSLPPLTLAMIRLCLLRHDFGQADQWIEILRQHGISGPDNVLLGGACENARRDALAATFYEAALATGHYPAAHLGLARLAAHRKDLASARRGIMRSLDMSRVLGEKAASPLDLFAVAIQQILSLEDPIPNARSWIATFQRNDQLSPLAGMSFQIYAADEKQAENYLRTVTGAMHPDQPPILPSNLVWKPAPRDQQPVGAVRPGIQNYWH